jgi:hypothetical protein
VPLEVKVRSVPPVRLAETEVFFGMVPRDEKAERRMQLWVDEDVSVEGIEVEEKPEWLEVEVAGLDERAVQRGGEGRSCYRCRPARGCGQVLWDTV